MTTRAVPFLVLCCTLMTTSLFLGCGSDPTAGLGDPVSVSGTVTLNGQPAAGVEVIFARQDSGAPPEYRNVSAITDASGAYSIETVFPAEYKVMIYERSAEQDENQMQAMDVGPYEKYGMESPLTAKVGADMTEHNFELKGS